MQNGVYLDFADAIKRLGKDVISARYGNLFEMYERITGDSPYETPMRIYPATHYTMGGLWVDYNLMSTIPGLFVAGEANFSDHGANRLGASALMQGLADGYFVIPYTIADYLAGTKPGAYDTNHAAFTQTLSEVKERTNTLLNINGTRRQFQGYTTDQAEVLRLGALVADRGGHAVDCPVSGGCHRAASGNISIFAGCDRAAVLVTKGRAQAGQDIGGRTRPRVLVTIDADGAAIVASRVPHKQAAFHNQARAGAQ